MLCAHICSLRKWASAWGNLPQRTNMTSSAGGADTRPKSVFNLREERDTKRWKQSRRTLPTGIAHLLLISSQWKAAVASPCHEWVAASPSFPSILNHLARILPLWGSKEQPLWKFHKRTNFFFRYREKEKCKGLFNLGSGVDCIVTLMTEWCHQANKDKKKLSALGRLLSARRYYGVIGPDINVSRQSGSLNLTTLLTFFFSLSRIWNGYINRKKALQNKWIVMKKRDN